ncbi:MAG TPA: hypothetical protein VGK76_01220 [Candidatus Eisenbacteria bacterium]
MLINREGGSVSRKIAGELERNPDLAPVLDVFESAPEGFEIDGAAAGLELIPVGSTGVAASRCRLKLFTPREGKERLCAFFYKRSNLAWSHDRFSYGGVEFRPEQITEVAVRSWHAWLCSGFDPERRPERLRRAFLYDIPE